MSFWMREATLQIGGKVYGMDDLYFEFEVPFEDSDTLQSATFKVYIASGSSRKRRWCPCVSEICNIFISLSL